MVTTRTRTSEANGGMQIKTILNRIQKQRGFVYGDVRLEEEQIGGLTLTIIGEVGPTAGTFATAKRLVSPISTASSASIAKP